MIHFRDTCGKSVRICPFLVHQSSLICKSIHELNQLSTLRSTWLWLKGKQHDSGRRLEGRQLGRRYLSRRYGKYGFCEHMLLGSGFSIVFSRCSPFLLSASFCHLLKQVQDRSQFIGVLYLWNTICLDESEGWVFMLKWGDRRAFKLMWS